MAEGERFTIKKNRPYHAEGQCPWYHGQPPELYKPGAPVTAIITTAASLPNTANMKLVSIEKLPNRIIAGIIMRIFDKLFSLSNFYERKYVQYRNSASFFL